MARREFARSVLPGLIRREWYSPFVLEKETRHLSVVPAAPVMAPLSLDIIGDVVGADLLSMAIHAAVCCVNVLAAVEHPGLRARINVGPLFIRFRIEISHLPRRNDR